MVQLLIHDNKYLSSRKKKEGSRVTVKMSSEYNPPSATGGVKPMSIAGRMVRERERLQGMSEEERAWRAQWLKDQVLAPDEPVVPPNYYYERYNILRRIYMAPLNKVEAVLEKPLVNACPLPVISSVVG